MCIDLYPTQLAQKRTIPTPHNPASWISQLALQGHSLGIDKHEASTVGRKMQSVNQWKLQHRCNRCGVQVMPSPLGHTRTSWTARHLVASPPQAAQRHVVGLAVLVPVEGLAVAVQRSPVPQHLRRAQVCRHGVCETALHIALKQFEVCIYTISD